MDKQAKAKETRILNKKIEDECNGVKRVLSWTWGDKLDLSGAVTVEMNKVNVVLRPKTIS
jgi:hypothetical protein